MENPGVLSLWIGKFRTKDSLKKYVEVSFDDNEDRVPSAFMRDFLIDFIEYNHDLLECSMAEAPTASLPVLLEGSSYEAGFLPSFLEHYGPELPETYNAAIRLYDFEYGEEIDEITFPGGQLRFMGSVVYEELD